MTSDEFTEKWWHKVVKPKGKYQIPDKEYLVTAALYQFNSDGTSVFAVLAKDYSPENRHWFTIHLTEEDLLDLDNAFEILQ